MATAPEAETLKRKVEAVLAASFSALEATGLSVHASGLDAFVFTAETVVGPVAIRVPKLRQQHSISDGLLIYRDFLVQEEYLAGVAVGSGVAAAEPLHLHLSDDIDLLISRFIDSDDSEPDWRQVGMSVARVHSLQPPATRLVAMTHASAAETIASRIVQRLGKIAGLTGYRFEADEGSLLRTLSQASSDSRLLHMDVWPDNILRKTQQAARPRRFGLMPWSAIRPWSWHASLNTASSTMRSCEATNQCDRCRRFLP